MKEVVFAVYRFQGGRWTRDRSFSSEQQTQAKAAAEQLITRPGVLGVTLVRETFVPATGATEEVGLWSKHNNSAVPQLAVAMSKNKPERAAAAAPARHDDDEGGADEDDEDIPTLVSPAIRQQPQGSPFLVVFKLVAALTVAGFVAGVISYVLARWELYGLFEFVLDRQNIQFKVFVGLFAVASLVVLPNMLTWREFAVAFQVQGSGPKRRPAQQRRRPQHSRARNADDDRGPSRGGQRESSANDGPNVPPDRPADGQQPAAPEPPPPEGPEVAEAKKSIMMFFARCVDFLMKSSSQFLKGGKLSTYNHFGCDLFLAGASEAYAERTQMPDKTKEIMAAVIRAAGRANDRASQFADKHENYLLEPRYLDMFRAGRDAMLVFMKDDDLRGKAAAGQLSKDDEAAMAADHHGGDIGMFLENALDHWNSKDDKKKEGGMIAVMFTAIVNAFTEAAGDEMAQKLVHAHNRSVREALRRYGGSEVKQTNDGIMASFPQASQAVEAAIAIQRDIEMNSSPQAPLHVKIGINAGEPIAENNDLFGTPVQLAARVCAFAASDQIAVSKLVRDLCQGKGLNFNDLGQAEFKGFGEKMPVYEVVWRDGMLGE